MGRGWGWQVKFYSPETGGGGRVSATLNGGTNCFGGRFHAVACRFSHTEWGHKKFPLCKREGGGGGAQQVLPCLERGRNKFRACDFPIFLAPPPLPVINDQSQGYNKKSSLPDSCDPFSPVLVSYCSFMSVIKS